MEEQEEHPRRREREGHLSYGEIIRLVREENSQNREQIQSNFEQIQSNFDHLFRRMSAVEAEKEAIARLVIELGGIKNTLDEFDVALRGNGRIGILEQLRWLGRWRRGLLVLMMVLLGFKVFGDATINQWFIGVLEDFGWKQKTVQVQNVVTPPSTNP